MKTTIQINKDTKIEVSSKSLSIADCFGTSSAELSREDLFKVVNALLESDFERGGSINIKVLVASLLIGATCVAAAATTACFLL